MPLAAPAGVYRLLKERFERLIARRLLPRREMVSGVTLKIYWSLWTSELPRSNRRHAA